MSRPLAVLIIDDSESDALLVVRELRNSGFTPEWERVDTAEALRRALRGREWRLVISDSSIPHLDALAALALVREEMPGLPFIVVSGTISEEIAVQTIRLGASDYVTKANLGRLGSAIARELAAIALARPRPGDSWKRATPPDSTFPLDRYNQYLRLLTEAGGIGASRSSTQPPYLCILVHADGWAGSARHASICWIDVLPQGTAQGRQIEENWYLEKDY